MHITSKRIMNENFIYNYASFPTKGKNIGNCCYKKVWVDFMFFSLLNILKCVKVFIKKKEFLKCIDTSQKFSTILFVSLIWFELKMIIF
jgi:hypothetical protein